MERQRIRGVHVLHGQLDVGLFGESIGWQVTFVETSLRHGPRELNQHDMFYVLRSCRLCASELGMRCRDGVPGSVAWLSVRLAGAGLCYRRRSGTLHEYDHYGNRVVCKGLLCGFLAG